MCIRTYVRTCMPGLIVGQMTWIIRSPCYIRRSMGQGKIQMAGLMLVTALLDSINPNSTLVIMNHDNGS